MCHIIQFIISVFLLSLKFSQYFVGIIGANGSGKTTLFRIILGDVMPDEGDVKIGQSVKFGYISQSRDSLNEDNEVWREICGTDSKIYINDGISYAAFECIY